MSILQEAINIVHGDRAKTYGDINQSFKRIAGFWSAYLNIDVTDLDVAKMMILLKVSRAKNNDYRDNYIDIAGYVECASQLLEQCDVIK